MGGDEARGRDWHRARGHHLHNFLAITSGPGVSSYNLGTWCFLIITSGPGILK